MISEQRLDEIEKAIEKTFPTSSELIESREHARELLRELKMLRAAVRDAAKAIKEASDA